MRKHSFEVWMAQELGVRAALVYECLHSLCSEKAMRNADYHDGLFWVRISYKDFNKIFPYMSEDTICRALRKLKNEGLIVVAHYDENNGTTNWYATT